MTYYAYMNSPRRHTAPSMNRGYNRAVGTLSSDDFKTILGLLEYEVGVLTRANVDLDKINSVKQLMWRVEQTGRLTR
ncbi:hypothetical protein [Acinetobacter ursingii]|uniref:hypothetical protein n=1 Tax=Acinetobacter ursingii TaxID=108980 RepID=UPI00124E5E7B|nr:hypothetical protein [Acinetobacter ursingii]